MRLDIFRIATPICAIVAVIGIVAPEVLTSGAQWITGTSFRALDWFFIASVSGFLIFSLVLAAGPWGRLKLGKPDDEPEFSTLSWLSMLFSAGMGAGRIDFRVEKAGVIHAPVGKASMGAEKLAENILALVNELIRLKPASAKGTYVRGVAVSSTMGVGVRIDPNDLLRAAGR